MKNAIILQGAGETQDSFWLPYVKKELEKRGYEVWFPQLPGVEDPQLDEILPFVLKGGKFSNETVIIAHSAGCPLVLSVLENIDVKIKQAILVAGYFEPSPEGPSGILQERYNWEKIRNRVEDIIFIHSDNDPWGCNDRQAREVFDKLGGTLIIKHGEGHMGSDTFNQPYKKFPLVVVLVENALWGPKET
jgi:predicted alpha/beta hydrolase family esterase